MSDIAKLKKANLIEEEDVAKWSCYVNDLQQNSALCVKCAEYMAQIVQAGISVHNPDSVNKQNRKTRFTLRKTLRLHMESEGKVFNC